MTNEERMVRAKALFIGSVYFHSYGGFSKEEFMKKMEEEFQTMKFKSYDGKVKESASFKEPSIGLYADKGHVLNSMEFSEHIKTYRSTILHEEIHKFLIKRNQLGEIISSGLFRFVNKDEKLQEYLNSSMSEKIMQTLLKSTFSTFPANFSNEFGRGANEGYTEWFRINVLKNEENPTYLKLTSVFQMIQEHLEKQGGEVVENAIEVMKEFGQEDYETIFSTLHLSKEVGILFVRFMDFLYLWEYEQDLIQKYIEHKKLEKQKQKEKLTGQIASELEDIRKYCLAIEKKLSELKGFPFSLSMLLNEAETISKGKREILTYLKKLLNQSFDKNNKFKEDLKLDDIKEETATIFSSKLINPHEIPINLEKENFEKNKNKADSNHTKSEMHEQRNSNCSRKSFGKNAFKDIRKKKDSKIKKSSFSANKSQPYDAYHCVSDIQKTIHEIFQMDKDLKKNPSKNFKQKKEELRLVIQNKIEHLLNVIDEILTRDKSYKKAKEQQVSKIDGKKQNNQDNQDKDELLIVINSRLRKFLTLLGEGVALSSLLASLALFSLFLKDSVKKFPEPIEETIDNDDFTLEEEPTELAQEETVDDEVVDEPIIEEIDQPTLEPNDILNQYFSEGIYLEKGQDIYGTCVSTTPLQIRYDYQNLYCDSVRVVVFPEEEVVASGTLEQINELYEVASQIGGNIRIRLGNLGEDGTITYVAWLDLQEILGSSYEQDKALSLKLKMPTNEMIN